jgi:nicotinate-nucleotide adenylyltransferase
MRLGIFGGTFDPVHYGHLLVAENCREQARLDQVWFLPAAVPPHKQQRELAPAVARVEILELAIGGHAPFSVCPYEIDRGGVNYTVDTLEHFRAQDPSRELFFLMGADSLRDLGDWKDPAKLCQLATPVVVCRSTAQDFAAAASGQGNEPLDWSALDGLVSAARLDAIRAHQVPMPRIDLSSSDLRHRVANGQSIRYRTPRAVEKYIETHGLYRRSHA